MKCLAVIWIAFWVAPAILAAERPPNIIVILADDLGAGDSAYSNPIFADFAFRGSTQAGGHAGYVHHPDHASALSEKRDLPKDHYQIAQKLALRLQEIISPYSRR